MGKRGKGPQGYPVPEGPHVGGKPLSELTANQKAAVIELGLNEEEWDTCTWHVYEDEMNKLKPAEKRGVIALGFDRKSWYLFCAIVRSKHAGWLKRIEQADKSAPRPAGEESNGKQPKRDRASRSKGAASTRAAVHADADDVLQGAAVADSTTAPPPKDAGPSHTMPYQTVPHNAIPCHTIPYPTIS